MSSHKITKEDVKWLTSCAALLDEKGRLTSSILAGLGDGGTSVFDALESQLCEPQQLVACEASAAIVYRVRWSNVPWTVIHHSDVYKLMERVAKLSTNQRGELKFTEYPFAIFVLRHDRDRVRKLTTLVREALRTRKACLVMLTVELDSDRRTGLLNFARDLASAFSSWNLSEARLLLEGNRALEKLSNDHGRIGNIEVYGGTAVVRLQFSSASVTIH